jgi:hypothetical protein
MVGQKVTKQKSGVFTPLFCFYEYFGYLKFMDTNLNKLLIIQE